MPPDPADFAPVPFEEAIRHFEAKYPRLGFDWRDTQAHEHLRGFTVAKVTTLDVLADIRAAMAEAIRDGGTFEEFVAGLQPQLKKRGWWGSKVKVKDPDGDGSIQTIKVGPRRLETIFRTNMRTAYMRGRWEQIERMKGDFPYLRYVAVLDSRTRDQHRLWHGLILPVDDPFWRTHYPPNGWRCRCTVQPLTEDDLKRYPDAPRAAPPIVTREWVNRRNGLVQEVPEGIDPGWAHNVGLADQLLVPGTPARLRRAARETALSNFMDGAASTNPNINPATDSLKAHMERVDRLLADGTLDRQLPLTQFEHIGLGIYSSLVYFRPINKRLRSGDPTKQWAVSGVRDTVNSALAKLPRIDGLAATPLHRFIDIKPEDLDDFLARYTPRTVVTEHAFTSTSGKVLPQFSSRNVELVIYSHSGRDVSPWAAKPDDQEILVPAGTRFKVLQVDRKSDSVQIDLEEVGDD